MIKVQAVLIDDALNAAAAIAGHAPARRRWILRRMLAEAAAADRHRRGTGRCHPIWGDGSLMTAARRRKQRVGRSLADPAFRAALLDVIEGVGTTYPDAQETHIGCVGSASSRPGAISSPQSVQ